MKQIEYINRPSELTLNSRIIFKMNDGAIYDGKVTQNDGYFVNMYTVANDHVFKELGLEANIFVENIVGYDAFGIWPEVKTLKDLNKVLDSLLKFNKSIIQEEIVEVKEDGEWDWLLS